MTPKIEFFLGSLILFVFFFAGTGFTGQKDSQSSHFIKITILYDNYIFNEDLKPSWGFSALIEGTERTFLFDTGADGKILLYNMQKLSINPEKIEAIFLSHIHGDHTGGLDSFLICNPHVSCYLPSSFPESFKQKVKNSGAKLVQVSHPVEIYKNIYSTGEMGKWIKEQSMLIKTEKGVIVITGCAHPGIVNIIKKAKEITKSNVYLVVGGFHLAGARSHQVKKIIQEFKKEGVEKVAPCHCSGDLTRKLFQEFYRENFIFAGVGKKIIIN